MGIHHTHISRFFVALVVVLATSIAVPAAADNTQFSGRATGVQANVYSPVPLSVTLADTGPIAAGGDALEASELSASVPNLLTADVLHSSSVGHGNKSRSESSLANLNLTVAGHTIGAEFLMARALAVCNGDGTSSVSGSSEIAALTIDGQTIAVSGQPNQTVDLIGGGQVIINEQNADTRSITVNALHVIVPGVADVIIASAHADVMCFINPACDSSKDFVTGGGWIPRSADGKSKATLAVAGGIKNGAYWGHLNYIDHVSGMKVKGTGVTMYVPVLGHETWRHIEGTCEINGLPGTYSVDVADNGEPGKDNDDFSIKLSNGYAAASKLGGGNIQLHNPCR